LKDTCLCFWVCGGQLSSCSKSSRLSCRRCHDEEVVSEIDSRDLRFGGRSSKNGKLGNCLPRLDFPAAPPPHSPSLHALFLPLSKFPFLIVNPHFYCVCFNSSLDMGTCPIHTTSFPRAPLRRCQGPSRLCL